MSTPQPAEHAADGDDVAPVYIRGVAHPLPPDERLLWEGAPDRALVAKHVFHRALVIGYFAIVTAWWAINTLGSVPAGEFLVMLGQRLLLGGVVVGVFEYLARAVARTTVYAITSKRIVLKIGIVLPMTINLPLSALANAGLGRFRDGSGQIALTLLEGQRLAYIALWPHCRVFSVNKPQPVLRGLADPDAVAEVLREAIVAEAGAGGVQVEREPAARVPAYSPASPMVSR